MKADEKYYDSSTQPPSGEDQGRKTETSSEGEKNHQNPCEYNTKGFCLIHMRKGEKYIVTSTVWKDRGGGKGFGNVYKKRVQYRCRSRIIPTLQHQKSSSINSEGTVS